MASPELYAEILRWSQAVILIAALAAGGGLLGTALSQWERHRRQIEHARRRRP